MNKSYVGEFPCACNLCKGKRNQDKEALWGKIATLVFFALFLMGSCRIAHADTHNKIVINVHTIDGYTLDQWCSAIYMAEGGNKTKHPYGILAKYKHTTPLQACRNTVRHKYSQWVKEGRKGAFVAYLGAKYCPVGCSNDNGTNKNWIKNVNYWLKKG